MGRFLLVRLLLLVPTLFGVLVVTFLLLYVAPGDPVQAMVGERADSATMARLRAELHLNDPVPVQFGRYVVQVAKGDLGRSYITNRPIIKDLMQRFPATLTLAGAAMLFAIVLGISIGVFGAWKAGGLGDRLFALLAYAGVSFPVYWVGLLLILVFAVGLHWFPA
ncbi:MAG TPA: ABC transporter permease, partial [Gemmatimonadales bacterium]|nr:ABC transporter permease [Gemmatimonadales bacterium]